MLVTVTHCARSMHDELNQCMLVFVKLRMYALGGSSPWPVMILDYGLNPVRMYDGRNLREEMMAKSWSRKTRWLRDWGGPVQPGASTRRDDVCCHDLLLRLLSSPFACFAVRSSENCHMSSLFLLCALCATHSLQSWSLVLKYNFKYSRYVTWYAIICDDFGIKRSRASSRCNAIKPNMLN